MSMLAFHLVIFIGSITLATFISATVSDSDKWQSHALATLGDATQIWSFLFMSCRPRWPRQVQSRDCLVSLLLMVMLTNVANVTEPLYFKMHCPRWPRQVHCLSLSLVLSCARLCQWKHGFTILENKLDCFVTARLYLAINSDGRVCRALNS